MTNRDHSEVDVYQFLEEVQLEQFFDKIHHVLHLTRLSHFDHVTASDLTDMNMSKPEQRRLMDALKRHKKERKKAIRSRFSLRKAKRKDSSSGVSDTLTSPKHAQKSCLITESSLALQEEIGNGHFGIVRQGSWTTNIGSKLAVAVKSLKYSQCEDKDQSDFMREANAMSGLDHPNVIHLYGVVLSSPIQLVMELAPLGSLLDRLKKEPQKFLISNLCDFVLQIASGMSYLESKRYVHRDVAARNLLLASYEKVKIGDFGLMRPLPIDEDIYVMNPQGRVPFAWCAPECLKTRQFSHASDVWAFGITVIEMFSYGNQPWEGLNASQILDLIDEPACSRPGKPDHCPDDIYSVLIEDCWAHKPSARSKFPRIKQRLNEVLPEDISMLYEVDGDEDSVKLPAQAGDKITVITWKSRLGHEFIKGQNRRTGQVGYFPIDQSIQTLTKKTSSKSRQKVGKVKDISPPLGNSFSHIAHRGEGETPNWGPVMTEERQMVGKQVPLNLPTKLISLKDNEEENQGTQDFDVKSMDSINGLETSSLSSRESTYSTGVGSLRSWSDSGYYSNRNTGISSNYEPMNGSSPISIPGNQAFSRGIHTYGANVPGHRTSAESSQSHQSSDQQRRTSTTYSEGSALVAPSTEIRPALPPKQGIVGRGQALQQSPRVHTDRDTVGRVVEDPYVNAHVHNNYENIYEAFSSHGFPLDPSLPSSSPDSFYSRETGAFLFTNTLYKGNRPLSESDGNYSQPATCQPQREHCEFCASEPCACPNKESRCHTFPTANMKNIALSREKDKRRNSVPSLEDDSLISHNATPESTTSPAQPCCLETTTAQEHLVEEIYENMDHYNVVGNSDFEINRPICTPPALPAKRRPLVRRCSQNSQSETEGVYSLPRTFSDSRNYYQNLRKPDENSNSILNSSENSNEVSESFYQHPKDSDDNICSVDNDYHNIYEEPHLVAHKEDNPWVPRIPLAPVDAHTYVEISQNVSQTLRLNNDDQEGEVGENVGARGQLGSQETFGEISNDFADLDAICAKLRESDDSKPADRKPLAHSQSVYQINPIQASGKTGEAIRKRFSADQETLNRYTFTKPKSCVPPKPTSSAQHRPPDKSRGLRTHVTLVTTV